MFSMYWSPMLALDIRDAYNIFLFTTLFGQVLNARYLYPGIGRIIHYHPVNSWWKEFKEEGHVYVFYVLARYVGVRHQDTCRSNTVWPGSLRHLKTMINLSQLTVSGKNLKKKVIHSM